MWEWLEKAHEFSQSGKPFVLATIINVKGSSPREVGAKMVVTGEGRIFGTVGGGKLEQEVQLEAMRCLKEAESERAVYPLCFRTGQCCGGSVEVFYEVMGLGPLLYLAGAGHVGQAVCQVLADTPFTIHLVDSRKEWVNHPELPRRVKSHGVSWEIFANQAVWDERRVYVAIMTHDHSLDEDIVADVIQRPARYIGLIGSETKWQRFERRLKERGRSPDEVGRVQCPLGVDIGGKSPKEVAISLAAQLFKLYHGK